MNVLELLENLNVFATKSEACKWVAAGAVKINGIRVTKEDDFNQFDVFSVEIGKSIKYLKNVPSKSLVYM